MENQDELHQLRRMNLQKATRIRQMGYKSSIHALPPDVKAKLDEFLSWKISPKKALAELCSLYPKVELPSPKAVEHYRNKHHKATLSKKITLIANKEIEMDLRKNKLEKELLKQIEFITYELLPKLGQRVKMALDKEDQVGLPLKIVDNSIWPLVSVIKMLADFLNKNDIRLFVQARQEPRIVPQASVDNSPNDPEVLKSAYAKLQEILEKRGVTITAPKHMQPITQAGQ